MKKMAKVTKLEDSSIEFDDNGTRVILESHHDVDCCETHYLDFKNLTLDEFEGLEFDLTDENFFKRVPEYGISLIPTNGHPISVPGYGYNNGYYTSNLYLILRDGNGILERYHIHDCQDIKWE